MTIEDYDTIINREYNAFFNEFQASRLDNLMKKLASVGKFVPEAVKRWQDVGVPALSGTTIGTPYELFCGGRTMTKFTKDLFKVPDKVEAAMDAALVDTITDVRNICRRLKPFGAWIGGWRTASGFLSPQKWERFVCPYMKKSAEVLVEEGVVPILHLDAN
jgi:hypothetical protein